MRKHLGILLAALALGLGPLAAMARPADGQNHTLIEPAQTTDDPARIEVVEFFSYACPHCNALNPLIHEWAGKLPPDIVFKRVPVNFNPFYELMARLFYTLETTGDLARLDAALFSAIHEKGQRLVDEKSITAWAVAQGIDARGFTEAWNSFGVNAKTKRAEQMAHGHRIQSVPAIAVDGRYLVNGKGLQDLLARTDEVIEMRREERNAARRK
ncbi:MAG: thiol:disulfide interchange protein DsbA/DsbL [Candidatus Accumulibacter sp.]|jgi:thiol:disulfide interchange protein DsbA|nr:thiol:disulfide interchange protein DsbA/DsbL [Accumulibacter sp.]